MFTTKKQDVINGIPVCIEQNSPYPLPWPDAKDTRPSDFYARIATRISWQNDLDELCIYIPSVMEGQNRKRVVQVTVNGEDYSFGKSGQGILDMNQTFDIVEMDKLVRTIFRPVMHDSDPLRVCTPFFHMREANYSLPYEKRRLTKSFNGAIDQTNGHIGRLVSPYIKALQHSSPGKKKEIHIPVATDGRPHHWNLCILSFDENNKPALTYLETNTALYESSDVYMTHTGFYLKQILPQINAVLVEHQFERIKEKDLKIDIVAQFSDLGCGFSLIIALQKILNNSLLVNGLNQKAFIHFFNRGTPLDKDFARITIEEDVMLRVQLAFALDHHDKYLKQADTQVSLKYQYIFESVLREIKSHPLTLARHAKEAFSDSDAVNSRQHGSFFSSAQSSSSLPPSVLEEQNTLITSSASCSHDIPSMG